MDSESREMFQKIIVRLDKIDTRLGKLESGQADIRMQLFKIDRKIYDTYNLALDAWGMGAENKELLEGTKLKA